MSKPYAHNFFFLFLLAFQLMSASVCEPSLQESDEEQAFIVYTEPMGPGLEQTFIVYTEPMGPGLERVLYPRLFLVDKAKGIFVGSFQQMEFRLNRGYSRYYVFLDGERRELAPIVAPYSDIVFFVLVGSKEPLRKVKEWSLSKSHPSGAGEVQVLCEGGQGIWCQGSYDGMCGVTVSALNKRPLRGSPIVNAKQEVVGVVMGPNGESVGSSLVSLFLERVQKDGLNVVFGDLSFYTDHGNMGKLALSAGVDPQEALSLVSDPSVTYVNEVVASQGEGVLPGDVLLSFYENGKEVVIEKGGLNFWAFVQKEATASKKTFKLKVLRRGKVVFAEEKILPFKRKKELIVWGSLCFIWDDFINKVVFFADPYWKMGTSVCYGNPGWPLIGPVFHVNSQEVKSMNDLWRLLSAANTKRGEMVNIGASSLGDTYALEEAMLSQGHVLQVSFWLIALSGGRLERYFLEKQGLWQRRQEC